MKATTTAKNLDITVTNEQGEIVASYSAPLAALKKSLRDEFPHVKSSHLSEALAHSLGFRTHAAMQAAMVGPEQDRPFALLQTQRFVERLKQLGYEDDPEFDFEMTILTPVPGVATITDIAKEINNAKE